MTEAAMNLQEQLDAYTTQLFAQEDDALRWIQAEAARGGLPTISVKPFEGRALSFLVRAVGAKTVVEIGTLAGYSGVWIARALPADGKLYTLEVSSKHAAVARASFEYAGVADRVELMEGAALDSLRKLSDRAPFDFVFLDADKDSYPDYYAWAVEHLRPGGMVAAHNAFRHGGVLTPENEGDAAIDRFNRTLAADPRVFGTILGLGDGFAVGIKNRA